MAFAVPNGFFFCLLLCSFTILTSPTISTSATEEESTIDEFVLTLDSSNFSDVVSKHDFLVVEFYAPWCGHCKSLVPEYEKAAYILSSHDPPVILAKVDANDETNKELANQFEINGFPTIKIVRNGGKNIQEYNGPREADGIVDYLKKQLGPASAEIKSQEDAGNLIDEKTIFVVGIFPNFSAEEFENFTSLAEKLRSEYDFGHTLDAKHLPRGELSVNRPTLRLFKPFDELVVDFEDFQVDAMEKFVKEASVPHVTIFNQDPSNHPYVIKFFESPNAKALLFVNFSSELHDAFKSQYNDVAVLYKGVNFLLGDLESSDAAFQYFGLKQDQAPLILIQNNDGSKYLKSKLEPNEIAPWLKEFMDGKLKPFIRSEPIPETNSEPVKVIVADSLHDMVFNSGKNVLLEFYAPWCGHCQKLAPILEEVAVSLESDSDVMIAKMDATANDIVGVEFDVQGYPTLYFRSASGKLLQYDGDRTMEDIIEFIKKNRDKTTQQDIVRPDSVKSDLAKDEL